VFGFGRFFHLAFEIRAGQIIEQQVVTGSEESVAPVSLRSTKKPPPGRISAVPRGRVREAGGERKLVRQPQPAAAMAC